MRSEVAVASVSAAGPGSVLSPPATTRFGFVLGTGRCGSTLVEEILARHDAVGFLSNLDDRLGLPASAGRWNSAVYRRLDPGLQKKGRARFAPSEGYRLLDRAVSPVMSEPTRDLLASDATPWMRDRLRGFFVERAAAQGQAVFLHKFTGWPRTGMLEDALPGSRYVHVVRDGRAVASSWLQMPWWKGYGDPSQWQFGRLSAVDEEEWERSGRSFVVLAGLGWRRLVAAFSAAREAVPVGSWLDVRYEDVLADPVASHRRMADHLGLAWSSRFEAQLARYEFTTGRAQAFRRDLGEPACTQLEAIVSEALEGWGYEV